MRYEFYCPSCNKKVKRKEVMPVVTEYSVTPKGYPRENIIRAYHFPGCKGKGRHQELQITIFEKKSKDIQLKLIEGGQ